MNCGCGTKNPCCGGSGTQFAGLNCARLSAVLYVDGGTTTPLNRQTGSICAPFKTIGQALTLAGSSAFPVGSLVDLEVVPGTYDENLIVPAQRDVTIRGIGGIVTVGGALNAGTITWDNGSPAAVTVATLTLDYVRVIGTITVAGSANVTAKLTIKGPVSVGNILGTALLGSLALVFTNSAPLGATVLGVINAPTAILEAHDWTLNGNVTISTYRKIESVTFGGNVTLTVAPGYPSGLFGVHFAAAAPAWTGPAASFLADGVTLHAALANLLMTFSAGLGATVVALDPEPELHFAAASIPTTAGSSFLYPWFEQAAATAADRPMLIARNGTLRGLIIFHGTPGALPDPITYFVLIDGAPVALSVTVAANATGGSNETSRVNVLRGQRVSLQANHTGINSSPQTIRASLIFD